MKSGVSGAATGTSTLGRLLDIEQLSRTLAFLETPRPRLDRLMPRAEQPEPYCTECGGPAGIFLGHGAVWQHFRGPDAGSRSVPAELYAADHAPVIGWRYTAAVSGDGPGHWYPPSP